MAEISHSELALLGLIVEQPRHAYEVEQVIEERNMRYWTEIGFSSIYRILNKLEKSGWLEGKMQPPEGKGPARKVYHLTAEGQRIWQEGVMYTLANPERSYSSFLIGLDSLSVLPETEVLMALQVNLEQQQAVHDELSRAIAAHPMKDNFYIEIFFDYILTQLANEIAWLEKLKQKLESRAEGDNASE